MNCNSEKKLLRKAGLYPGFTLIEAAVAVSILTVIVSTVMVVMNRCVEAVIDSKIRMQAFEIARNNMEELLSADSVRETAEFGISEENPNIQWETLIETFNEPINSEMWIRAVCSASYTDTKNEI